MLCFLFVFCLKCVCPKAETANRSGFIFPGVALTADTKVQRMPSESAAQSLAVASPSPQARWAMEQIGKILKAHLTIDVSLIFKFVSS